MNRYILLGHGRECKPTWPSISEVNGLRWSLQVDRTLYTVTDFIIIEILKCFQYCTRRTYKLDVIVCRKKYMKTHSVGMVIVEVGFLFFLSKKQCKHLDDQWEVWGCQNLVMSCDGCLEVTSKFPIECWVAATLKMLCNQFKMVPLLIMSKALESASLGPDRMSSSGYFTIKCSQKNGAMESQGK